MLIEFHKVKEGAYFRHNDYVYRKGPVWCTRIDKYSIFNDAILLDEEHDLTVTLLVEEPILIEGLTGYKITKYFDDQGRLHRSSGPAMVYAENEQYWYKHGTPHRLDGPAKIWPSGAVEYYIDGFYYDSYLEYLVVANQYNKAIL